HGLVCAPSDQVGFQWQWGCYGTDIGGTSTAFGTGQANTNLILAGCYQPMKIPSVQVGGQYS
ncbi:MAG: hypothetical protein ACKO7V_04870, partial [Bacteroidota bacterium]